MKKIIKTFLLILSLTLLASFTAQTSATSVTTTTDDGKYNYTTQNEVITQIAPSTTYIKNIGYATRGSKQYSQTNHIFVADYNQGDDIKVVSWAVKNSDGTGYVRQSIKAIAEDYEKNHPGYIVLCGINADQYIMYFGTNLMEDSTDYYRPQSVYPLIADGENWFVISLLGETFNTVGFKNDGSKDAIVYGERSIKGLYIHIYNENNVEIASYPATDLNLMDPLNDGETTVISPYRITDTTYQPMEKESSNGFYIVEAADNAYVYNSVAYAFYKGAMAKNAFFGKGTISKIDNKIDLKKNQFAIETTNEDLKKALSVGTYVKVQYDLDDGFNGIQESAGYHTLQRSHGVDQNVDNPYNTRPYPRSIVGCDADGKIYMITNEGSNSSPTVGMYAQESNALMKQYGITDAFQMDGGGSVCCVIRNDSGVLEYAMPSVESDYRYDLSGLFVVMKVTNASLSASDIDQTSATINCDLSNVTEKYTKAYIKYYEQGKVQENYQLIENGKVTLTNLKSNTTYQYILVLELENGKKKETLVKSTFKTYADFPTIENVHVTLNEETGKYEVHITYSDPYSVLVKMQVLVNGKDYYAKFSGGEATVTLNSTIPAILDLGVEMQCSEIGKIVDTTTYSFKLTAETKVYFSNAISIVEEYINKLFK